MCGAIFQTGGAGGGVLDGPFVVVQVEHRVNGDEIRVGVASWSLGQAPPLVPEQPSVAVPGRPVVRRDRVGGVIGEYSQAA